MKVFCPFSSLFECCVLGELEKKYVLNNRSWQAAILSGVCWQEENNLWVSHTELHKDNIITRYYNQSTAIKTNGLKP